MFALLCWVPTDTVSAASYDVNSYHNDKVTKYDCTLVSKPSKPDWVWYRYPTKKHPKRDAYDNGKIHLIWEDSYRAHVVEIKYRAVGSSKWKTKKTGDDAQHVFKNLKNGKFYEFKVRGISNCGKGSWQTSTKIGNIRP